jgi:hypothetical protein
VLKQSEGIEASAAELDVGSLLAATGASPYTEWLDMQAQGHDLSSSNGIRGDSASGSSSSVVRSLLSTSLRRAVFAICPSDRCDELEQASSEQLSSRWASLPL